MDQNKKECELRSAEYEKLVKEILEELYPQYSDKPIKIIKKGRSSKRKGASGFNHQIDIQIENEERLFLVECKCWNSIVPPEKVLAFFGRIYDIKEKEKKPVTGLMATTKSYNKGVRTLATYFDIDLEIYESTKAFSLRILELTMLRKTESISVKEKTDVKIIDLEDSPNRTKS